MTSKTSGTLRARDALDQLKAGNRRFINGEHTIADQAADARQHSGTEPQKPFAVILGCSDSRVPVEIVFDQGLGELFVIRVAGNIVAPSQIGSIEFAAQAFGTRLVVVLGHTHCGAIAATVDALRGDAEHESRNLYSIVDRIKPSASNILAENPNVDRESLITAAVRANVRSSVRDLRQGSTVLADLQRDDDLLIVGAEYSLATGEVDFFEADPQPG